MRTTAAIALLALVSWCTPCAAVPYAMLKWDSCDSGEGNKPFAGPGVYREVISGAGFSAAVRGYMIRLHITAANVYDSPSLMLPDAWRFDRPIWMPS